MNQSKSQSWKVFYVGVHLAAIALLVWILKRTSGIRGGMTTERRVTVRLEKQLRMRIKMRVRRMNRMKVPFLRVALRGTNEKKLESGCSSIVGKRHF